MHMTTCWLSFEGRRSLTLAILFLGFFALSACNINDRLSLEQDTADVRDTDTTDTSNSDESPDITDPGNDSDVDSDDSDDAPDVVDPVDDPSCSDGELNGEETDVDCGGPDCPACAPGMDCNEAEDCLSGVCMAGFCQLPTCSDGVQNRDETDIDCGGDTCAACEEGQQCLLNQDCESNICADGICRASSCGDGVLNGDETDIDCGGSCGACSVGQSCEVADDCGTPTNDDWGACQDFSGTCGQTGEQFRTRYQPACENNTCVINEIQEQQACTRTTTGNSCGTTQTSSWSACSYSNQCSNTGTRTRQVTTFACASGSCQPTTTTETDSSDFCSRNQNGNACGDSTVSLGPCVPDFECSNSGTLQKTTTPRVCNNGACGNGTPQTEQVSCPALSQECQPCGNNGLCFDNRCNENMACP